MRGSSASVAGKPSSQPIAMDTSFDADSAVRRRSWAVDRSVNRFKATGPGRDGSISHNSDDASPGSTSRKSRHNDR